MSFISNWLYAQTLKDGYITWLESLKGKRAVDLGKQECQRCGFCCAMRPCIPTPNELRTIAEFLNMTTKECVQKYFVVDRLGGRETKFIFPAKESQTDITGRFIDWERTYDKDYCIFYDKEGRKCKIYPVRPEYAKTTSCWIEESLEAQQNATDKALKDWETVDFSEFTDGDIDENDDDW